MTRLLREPLVVAHRVIACSFVEAALAVVDALRDARFEYDDAQRAARVRPAPLALAAPQHKNASEDLL